MKVLENSVSIKKSKFIFTMAMLLMILVNLFDFYSYGQLKKIRFIRTSIEEGLSQSSVTCILKDNSQLMWFGTQDGLNCYDGYSFRVFFHDPEQPSSLSNNYINTIYEDKQGELWIGTANGLNRLDRETGTFIQYKKKSTPSYRISGNQITAICEDKDGVLWAGTADGGLNKYDLKENNFVFYQRDIYHPNNLISDHIGALFIDSAGLLWIGTQDRGLTHFDQKEGTYRHFQSYPNVANTISDNHITAIAEDRDGNIWIGTVSGLNRLNPKDNTIQRFLHSPDNPNSIAGNEIYSIHVNHDGNILIGTESGVALFDPEKENFSYWCNDPTDPFSLSSNVVLSILEDSAHILWIGTDGGGINRYAPYRNRFDLYQHHPDFPSQGLSGKFVYTFFQDREGFVWIGTDSGLNRFDEKNNSFKHYKARPSDPQSLNNDYVFSIHEDDSGIMWIGTWGGGLNRFDRQKEKFRHYLQNPLESLSISNNIVRVIHEDSNGDMWIGTEGGGLNLFDPKHETFLHYKTIEDNPASISDNHIRAIAESPKGTLWIGTRYGLNRFDIQTGDFIPYTLDENDRNSLSNNQVNSIHVNDKGIIWIGTSGGLNRFNPRNGQFTRYAEKDGLPNHVIWGILEDTAGNLWLSTNNGLSKFNPQQKTFKNYDIRDGLQSNEFNLGACLKTRQEKMYFGGINGFNVFLPCDIKDNPFIPPIIITKINITSPDNPHFSSSLYKTGCQVGKIRLTYCDCILSFEFASLDYTSPAHNRYAYMMEGLDKNWHHSGTRRFASYHSLPPGSYRFRVKGSNNDGIWNETGIALPIYIAPTLWRTWWFRGMVLIILTALGYLLFETRKSIIRKRTIHLKQIDEKLNQQIIARKQAEGTALKIQLRLDTLLETTHEGIIELDDKEIIRDVNPEICAILYRSREDIINRHIGDFINPEDIHLFRQAVNNPGNKIRGSYTLTLFRSDKSPIHCLVKIAPFPYENPVPAIRTLVMVTDISEIIRAESELQQTKNYLDNVFNSISSIMITVDKNGIISQWNTAAESLLGITAQEALSREVYDAVPFLNPYREKLHHVFRSGESLELHRERLQHGKEETRFLNIVVYPLVYEGLTGSVIRMDDVTEVEKKDLQLLQAQKMETVGNLAGGLAHDFNNVLGGIVGTVSLIKFLLDRGKKIDLTKLKNQVETIEKSACRAVNLVNQLLTLSRKNEPLFASVDLNEILKDVIKICQNTFDKSIEFDLSYQADQKAMIWADASQVEQVLLNLCINASQAMTLMRKPYESQGGILGISLRDFYADHDFCDTQSDAKEGNYWLLEISDTGVGIAPNDLQKIFDPFFTTKEKLQGTGLGLAMVYNIVKQHRGFIEVTSQLNIGTTFRIFFPHSNEQEYRDQLPQTNRKLIRGSGLILVVDDEESLRITLKEILETCGYQVILAEDGYQGIEIVKEKCEQIKLVILDLAMPHMAGKESYLEMKKIFPQIKVLLTSGFKHDQRVKEIIKLGVDGFLPKPFSMPELSKKIAEIINPWKLFHR